MNKETAIQNRVRLALSRLGGVVTFRNNVGQAKTEDGRFIQYGLAKGSSDLIGWRTLVITPDMVGKRLAVFLALEVKAAERARRTRAQINFISQVKQAGGIAEFVTSDVQAVEVLNVFSK